MAPVSVTHVDAGPSNQARRLAHSNTTLSPTTVLSIAPTGSSQAANPAPTPPGSLAEEYRRSARLKPLLDRLKSGASTSADGKLALYLVLRECAKVQGGGEDRPAFPDVTKLSMSISDDNPDKQQRLQTARELKARCEGLDDVATSSAQLRSLLNDSAAGGNQEARVRALAHQLVEQAQPGELPQLSDAHLQVLREAISSRDPGAILSAGIFLSNTFADLIVEDNATHDPIQPTAAVSAWRLISCEYGADCGASNTWLQLQCAADGECAASNVQDAIFYYEVSPYQAQLIERYRNIFDSAVNGDWSEITLARRPGGPGSRYHFGIP